MFESLVKQSLSQSPEGARRPAVKYIQGDPKKLHKVYGTIILQPYITESSGFQQNVLKEILYMT